MRARTASYLIVPLCALASFGCGPPTAPSDLSATVLSPAEVALSWNDTSDNESEFQVQRETGDGAFTLVTAIGANSTDYIDDGLNAGTTYTYRARASNAAGASDWSNDVEATTQQLMEFQIAIQLVSPTTYEIQYGSFTGALYRPAGTMEVTAWVAGGAENYQWYLDASALSGETNQTVKLYAAEVAVGTHVLGVRVIKSQIPYSASFAFEVRQ